MNEIQCRICLKETKKGISISKSICNQPIWSSIAEISTISIELNDGLPQFICLKCSEDLQISIELRHTIQITDAKLRASSAIGLSQVFVKTEVDSSFESNEWDIITKHDDEHEIVKPNIPEIGSAWDIINDDKTLVPKVSREQFKKTRKRKLEPLHCCMCSEVFDLQTDLKAHCDAIHPEGKPELKELTVHHKYACPYCHQRFHMKKHLREHFKDLAFEEPQKVLVKYKKYKSSNVICPICGVKLHDSASLLLHQASKHTEVKSIICDIGRCKSTFGHELALRRHQQSCHSEKKYTCDYCSKSYCLLSKLRQHMFVHVQRKPIQCDKCDKSFSKEYLLKGHILAMHSGIENPFSCEFCPSSYKYKGDLQKHRQAYHFGKFPSVCKFCGKGYTSSSSKNYHEQRCPMGKKQ